MVCSPFIVSILFTCVYAIYCFNLYFHSHRFDKKFNCNDPTCRCGTEEENIEHYFLRCPSHALARATLMSSISDIVNPEIVNLPNEHLTSVLLFGSKAYSNATNKLILEACIRFCKKSKRIKVLQAYSFNT